MAQRKKYTPEFKAKAALEAIKGLRTINEIAGELGVHPVQLSEWKKQALQGLPEVFARPNNKSEAETQALLTSLYNQIGQLTMELEWLKKKSGRLR